MHVSTLTAFIHYSLFMTTILKQRSVPNSQQNQQHEPKHQNACSSLSDKKNGPTFAACSIIPAKSKASQK